MRLLTSLLLSLVLAVTSVTFAAARVQAAELTQIVICAQGAARLVTLDAAGNPVEAPHHCPDCLAALPPPPSAVVLGLYSPVPRAVVVLPAQGQAAPARAASTPLARGPPRLV